VPYLILILRASYNFVENQRIALRGCYTDGNYRYITGFINFRIDSTDHKIFLQNKSTHQNKVRAGKFYKKIEQKLKINLFSARGSVNRG
jgi:hypothetical protein